MGWVRKFVFQTALAALLATTPVAAHAAIFDDGNDRHLVKDLRAKDPASLTAEEKAILAAANKVGDILACGSGNGFLIRHKACPANGAAAVTSAHMMLETDGSLKCTWDEAGQADYMPNSSYFYKVADRQDKWITRKVGLQFPPVNWTEIKSGRLSGRSDNDLAVFCLDEDVTQDRMPDGSKRGYFRFSATTDVDGRLFMFGRAEDVGNYIPVVYQTGCNGSVRANYLYHACDNIVNSSGSFLGVMEKGEIRFRGLHNNGLRDVRNLPASAKDDESKLNGGTSSDRILSGRHQTELAHDLQWVLQQAGCYSGKLDGDWGPASRKALAAFAAAAATELPGAEPSPELLVAVEKVAPEGMELCRR